MSKKPAATSKPKAKAAPKAPAEPTEPIEAPAKPQPKLQAKPKTAKPSAKPEAKEVKPEVKPEVKVEETLSPEDAKIREHFKNPNVTFTGVYRSKILEWISLYEELGVSNPIWRDPKKVWKDPQHPAYESWSRFTEGFSNHDVQQLMNAAYENQQNAMVEMLACWFAMKLAGLSPDQMIREIQQS